MNKEFLYKYLNATSPTGDESEGQKIWCEEINKIADLVSVESYGTAVASFFNHTDARNIGIEAHCDEIGWIVNKINSDGDIRVARLGGSDSAIAPSMRVTIHTHDGKKVKGVFGSPAIHVKTKHGKNESCLDPHELWLDIGLDSDKEVLEAGVEVGNLVTMDAEFAEMGEYYVGKALDNKIGGFIIYEVARRIKERYIKLPFNLFVINAVQEEVGLFGAKRIAKQQKLDMILVHDVCHNTYTPGIDKNKEGDTKGGNGPAIEYTSQNNKRLNQFIREVAKDKEIPLQLTVGSYGNDTIGYFLENIVTSIISTPVKYMHTTVEMAHKKDVENAIELFIAVLENLTEDNIDDIINLNYKLNK